jgi:hypothetical protein
LTARCRHLAYAGLGVALLFSISSEALAETVTREDIWALQKALQDLAAEVETLVRAISDTDAGGTSSGGTTGGTGGTSDLPSVASLAEFVETMTPGAWAEVPNSSIQQVLLMESDVQPGAWSKGSKAVINNWQGSAFDGRKMYFHGGGHASYGGNEIYAFDLENLSWELVIGNTAELLPPTETERCLGLVDPSVPAAGHTYDALIYSPTDNSIYTWGSVAYCRHGWGGGTTSVWRFDLETKKWSYVGPRPESGYYKTALDPATGDIYAMGLKHVFKYDTDSGTYSSLARLGRMSDGTAAFDPDRGVFAITTSRGIYAAELTSDGVNNLGIVSPVPDGETKHPFGQAGVAYDAGRKVFVLWRGGREVWTLDPDTWEIVEYANASGDASIPEFTRVYGKWHYVESLGVFVGYNNVNEGVWVYKLPDSPQEPLSTP